MILEGKLCQLSLLFIRLYIEEYFDYLVRMLSVISMVDSTDRDDTFAMQKGCLMV